MQHANLYLPHTHRNSCCLAFLSGAASALAMPPFHWFPILWLSLPLLLLLLVGATTPRRAFVLGWSFAFGYFVCGLYWIAAALLVDWQKFFWLVPITVAGLPAVLALYYGLAAALWHKLYQRQHYGIAAIVSFALLFSAAEYLRGHLFTGFPWNLFGYSWTAWLPMAQTMSLVGVYGLTLLTLVVACLPAALLLRARYATVANVLGLGVVASLALWGAWRIPPNTAFAPTSYVRLVQPNIAQSLKWDKAKQAEGFQTLLSLSAQKSEHSITHIIWPETALTFDITQDATHRAMLQAVLPDQAIILAGMVRREPNHTTMRWDYYNSLVAMAKTGTLLARYDKAHLVPFGEYVPLRGFAPVAAVTAGLGNFVAGSGVQTLQINGLPAFSPLICYEVIFPNAVADRNQPPQLLINITNDAWYGDTSGPYQHLAISQMRAIEQGVPLLRVANTGISAIIDAHGRVVQQLPLQQQGVIDGAIPSPLATPTFYASYGDGGFMVLWLLLAMGCAYSAITTRLRPACLAP
jgi:apolipoprotein N-acyltransferase